MSGFHVYQDQENVIPQPKAAVKASSRRPVLAVINANVIEEKDETGDKLLGKNHLEVREKKSEIPNSTKQLTIQECNEENEKVQPIPMSDGDSPMIIDSQPNCLPKALQSQLDDLQDCTPYREDVHKYLRELELCNKPKPYYMRRQPDVTYSMRAILVDWLVEVGEEFKLHNETLFMAVGFVDRFLSSMAVVRGKLQLLGTSAMFIAAKFEEIYPPDVEEFTYITDDTYTKKQVLRMEHLILKVLSFDLSFPTPYTFVVHISSTVSLPHKIMFLAMYISELTLLEADPYLEINPSLIAAGAIALAKHCCGYVYVWPVDLAKASGYSLASLALVVGHLNNTHMKSFNCSQGAIREKYKSSKYLCVSQIPSKKLIIRDTGTQP